MNVFMPHLYAQDSVQALDNKRLCRQILECMQIINIIEKYRFTGNKKLGYLNHPVTKFYMNNYNFLICYAYVACKEFEYRFNKTHAYTHEITVRFELIPYALKVFGPASIFYHEGKDIRTYDPFVSTKLFKLKLCQKWITDICKNRIPKWSERNVPSFFEHYLKDNYKKFEAIENSYLKQYISKYKENQ